VAGKRFHYIANYPDPTPNATNPKQLLGRPEAAALFPADAVKRAREFLEGIPGGLGAYSDSAGAAVCRRQIAAAIAARDGTPCDPEDIYMTVRGFLFGGGDGGCCVWGGAFKEGGEGGGMFFEQTQTRH
jgi:hypothetical protein